MSIPRRAYLDKWTPEELKIRDAMAIVEELGANPLLTDCIVLLDEAFGKLADYTDQNLRKDHDKRKS